MEFTGSRATPTSSLLGSFSVTQGLLSSVPRQRPQTKNPSTELTGMQALHNGGGVDEIAPTEGTHEVGVQLSDFNPCGSMHDARDQD